MKNFFRAFLTELKCRVCSLSFAIPIIIVAAGYLSSMLEEIEFMWNARSADVLYFWELSQNIGSFTPISLLCCTALNCTSFLNDYSSDYYRSSVLRSGKRSYTLSKFLSCVVAGGLILCLGMVLFILILRLRFPLISDNSSMLESNIHAADMFFGGELMKGGHYIGYFAVFAFLAFLFGALWSAVGICVSAFITDKYVASFSPYVLWYASERILSGKFRTKVVFNGNYNLGGVGGSLLWAVGYFGIIIAILGIIFCIKAGRRCQN